MRPTRASLSARVSGAGKWRMTSGSALSAANGARCVGPPLAQDEAIGAELGHARTVTCPRWTLPP